MSNTEEKIDPNSDTEYIEWEYALPPTPYDLIRDSYLLKTGRLIIIWLTRLSLRCYNRLKIIGKDNILSNWPCIITPNHSSHLDAPVVFASLPFSYINGTFTLAAKDYFFNRAIITLGARLMSNAIPIDRTGSESRGLRLCLSKQREGKSILMFPEGTRSKDGEIWQFHKGAVILSRKSRIAIIPAYIEGTYKSLPRSRIFPKPQSIFLVYGEPVCYWDGTLARLTEDEAVDDLKMRVQFLRKQLRDMESKL